MTSIEEIVRRIVREEVRAALEQQRSPERQVDERQLLSLREAAAYLGLSEATLRDWRVDRKGPPALKYGRLVKYCRADLDEWIADQTRR